MHRWMRSIPCRNTHDPRLPARRPPAEAWRAAPFPPRWPLEEDTLYANHDLRYTGDVKASAGPSSPAEEGAGDGTQALGIERRPQLFPTTRWTTLLQPIRDHTEVEQAALSRLLEVYRRPIVEFVKAHVRNPQDAEDLAHSYIERLLRRDDLSNMNPRKGRFRSFLCQTIRNFLATHYEALDANKRRALNQAEPIDDMLVPPSHSQTPESALFRSWARAQLDETLKRLKDEWEAARCGQLFPDFEALLWERDADVAAVAKKHSLTPNAVYVRLSRMRARYKELFREIVAETVDSPGEVDDEVRFLRQYL
jgi:RNA polymerase sigma factor (sigma-70 family)